MTDLLRVILGMSTIPDKGFGVFPEPPLGSDRRLTSDLRAFPLFPVVRACKFHG